jgi:molybdopterin/thiamine biosynthesis adenylyltransferase
LALRACSDLAHTARAGALAAAGVGTIGIADDDVVSLSNLQRQVIFGTEDIDAPKSVRAAAAVHRLNPDVEVLEHRLRIDAENASSIVSRYDLVAEGIDSFSGRYALNRACITLRKPLVSAALGRFEGQVSVFKPWAAPGLPCYRCFVPEPPPRERAGICDEEGVLGPVAGAIGAVAAIEALKEILGIGAPLAGRLFIIDALKGESRTVTLRADPQCPDCRSDLQ